MYVRIMNVIHLLALVRERKLSCNPCDDAIIVIMFLKLPLGNDSDIFVPIIATLTILIEICGDGFSLFRNMNSLGTYVCVCVYF